VSAPDSKREQARVKGGKSWKFRKGEGLHGSPGEKNVEMNLVKRKGKALHRRGNPTKKYRTPRPKSLAGKGGGQVPGKTERKRRWSGPKGGQTLTKRNPPPKWSFRPKDPESEGGEIYL